MRYWLLKTIYFCISLSVASLQFLNLYYSQIGLTTGEIGALFAVGPLVMVLTQPVWGMLTDFWNKPKWILLITIVGSAITAMFFPQMETFQDLLILNIVYSFFVSATGPIADSIALGILEDRNDFGKIRLYGSLGYAIGAITIGRLLDYVGLDWMFYFYTFSLIITLLLAMNIPAKTGSKKHFRLKEALGLFKNPSFITFLLFNFLLQLTVFANNSFYAIHLESFGATITLVGLALLIKSILEIPFFAISSYLIRKFSYALLLSIATVFYAARWLILGYSDQLDVLIWSQILLSLSFSIHCLASVAYVDFITPPDYRATGQTIYWAVTFGFGGLVGNILAGWLLKSYSIESMYKIAALLAMLSIVFLWIKAKDQRVKTAAESSMEV
ncbi:hypothetical protein WQ54_05540 [Bacillus sp. SA1-12]|uniref:MFS transporter n=1 Tax=Bacillus sp. SA1-12 TaxID=1455638 RepID=UPI00062631F2|nr:MFS transporter [Bacillus sp. SA1-12]KKI93291.1 hypothetical protein WQ54_05540 [Bacillus sp. SA1-12]